MDEIARLPDDARRPIERPSLHHAVVNRVRDMIIEGTLPAGSRIHESQLGAELGVSRTPLREALKFLASEGLVDLVAGRGAVVRRFTPKDVRDSLTVLASLEALAGRLACTEASDAEIAAVRRLHDAMMECYARRDRLVYFKLNQDIHSAILRLTHNDVLMAIHASVQARLKRIRYIGNEGPEKWKGAVADHEEMMAALEARDAQRLAEILSLHMDRTWDRVKDSL